MREMVPRSPRLREHESRAYVLEYSGARGSRIWTSGPVVVDGVSEYRYSPMSVRIGSRVRSPLDQVMPSDKMTREDIRSLREYVH